VRAVLVVIALAGCARAPSSPASGSSPAEPPPVVAAEGEILDRAPCPLPADAGAFAAEIDTAYRADLVRAGLEAELAARPLTTLYPPADHARLVDAARVGRCERITYRSDGLRVVGFAVRPRTPGRHPVLLWLRGGNRDFGKNGALALVHMLDLADAGFVVLAPQYRGADGGEGTDGFGGADLDDVLILPAVARQLDDADPSRLFVFGGSRGAMQGLMAIRRGLPVRAACRS